MQERSPKTGYERVYLHLFDIVMQTVELELFEKHLKRIGRRKPRWRSCGSLPRRDLVNASRNRNNKYRKKEHGKCRRRGNLKYKPEREREREREAMVAGAALKACSSTGSSGGRVHWLAIGPTADCQLPKKKRERTKGHRRKP